MDSCKHEDQLKYVFDTCSIVLYISWFRGLYAKYKAARRELQKSITRRRYFIETPDLLVYILHIDRWTVSYIFYGEIHLYRPTHPHWNVRAINSLMRYIFTAYISHFLELCLVWLFGKCPFCWTLLLWGQMMPFLQIIRESQRLRLAHDLNK